MSPKPHTEHQHWAERLDNAVDRFAEATSTLSASIAVHAQRLDTIDDMTKEIIKDNRQSRDEHQRDYRFLNEKFESSLKTHTQQLKDHLDLKIAGLTTMIHESEEDQTKKTDDLRKDMLERTNNLSKRTRMMERTYWIAAGALGIIAFIIKELFK